MAHASMFQKYFDSLEFLVLVICVTERAMAGLRRAVLGGYCCGFMFYATGNPFT